MVQKTGDAQGDQKVVFSIVLRYTKNELEIAHSFLK